MPVPRGARIIGKEGEKIPSLLTLTDVDAASLLATPNSTYSILYAMRIKRISYVQPKPDRETDMRMHGFQLLTVVLSAPRASLPVIWLNCLRRPIGRAVINHSVLFFRVFSICRPPLPTRAEFLVMSLSKTSV